MQTKDFEIVVYWDKEHPRVLNITRYDICPWITANWVDSRPATPEEIEMYNNGICIYSI